VTAIPLGRWLPSASSNLPGRPDPDTDPGACAPRRPYSVLLPVGFAVPLPLPAARCALTAPFHPCRGKTLRPAAVCSLWHCPWGCPRRTLSGTACPWSPDFPPRRPFGPCRSGRPVDWRTTDGADRSAGQAGHSRRSCYWKHAAERVRWKRNGSCSVGAMLRMPAHVPAMWIPVRRWPASMI